MVVLVQYVAGSYRQLPPSSPAPSNFSRSAATRNAGSGSSRSSSVRQPNMSSSFASSSFESEVSALNAHLRSFAEELRRRAASPPSPTATERWLEDREHQVRNLERRLLRVADPLVLPPPPHSSASSSAVASASGLSDIVRSLQAEQSRHVRLLLTSTVAEELEPSEEPEAERQRPESHGRAPASREFELSASISGRRWPLETLDEEDDRETDGTRTTAQSGASTTAATATPASTAAAATPSAGSSNETLSAAHVSSVSLTQHLSESARALLELELQHDELGAKRSLPTPGGDAEDLRSLPASTDGASFLERRRTGGFVYVDGPSDEIPEDYCDVEFEDESEDDEFYDEASSAWEDGTTVDTIATPTVVMPHRRKLLIEGRQDFASSSCQCLGANEGASGHNAESGLVSAADTGQPPRTGNALHAFLRTDRWGDHCLDNDDFASVQSDETPVLERYRIDVDEESTHGFRVVPNPRGSSKRRPINAAPSTPHRAPEASAVPFQPAHRSPGSALRKLRPSYKLPKMVPSAPTIDENAPLDVPGDELRRDSSLALTLHRQTMYPTQSQSRYHPSTSQRLLRRLDPVSPGASPSERPPLRDDWEGVGGEYQPRLHHSLPSSLLYTQAQLALTDHSNMLCSSLSSHLRASWSGRGLRSPRQTIPPMLPYVSQDEYDSASRVVRMQVTLEEVERTIRALNVALQQDRYWEAVDAGVGVARHVVKYQLREPDAKRLLSPLGFDDRKAKTVLSCLCHWRRLIVRRPSSAGAAADASFSKEAAASTGKSIHVFEVPQEQM